LGPHPNQVTVKEARAFAAYLREPNSFRWGIIQHEHRVKFELSPYSVQSYGRAVKTFFNWLEREGYIEQTPFNKSVRFTNRHKQDRVVKRVENEDLAQLFEYLTDSEIIATFAGTRNLSMISFLLDTGIRRGELLSMKMGSLNLVHAHFA
jgi:site-specific recombinase XerD